MPDASARDGSSPEWASTGERGSQLALRFVVGIVNTLGTRPLALLLAPIAAYFALFASTARKASLGYLRRIRRIEQRPGEPGFKDVYRHLYAFSSAILDRLALWSKALDDFDIAIHGGENMDSFVEAGTGAILVGAHIGNFDVLRIVAREAGIPVNVLMYSENAERINRAFEALDPNCNVRLIDLEAAPVNTGLEIRKCIDRGEFVAVMGDRVLRAGARDRVGYASFLGEPAAFPQGPFLLANLLGLPVVFTVALRRGPRQYDVYIESISKGGRVSRARRNDAIQQNIEAYAELLEQYCLKAPFQWFNFYDFWAKDEVVRF
jgi:predicted LPLAT superfamily acyltransferase